MKRHDLDRLHDRIVDVFDIDVTDNQINKIVSLFPDWDGIVDTLGEEEIMDLICQHFIGMEVPMYGSSKEYKLAFREAVKNKKRRFESFILS